MIDEKRKPISEDKIWKSKSDFQKELAKKSTLGEDPMKLLANSGLSMPSHLVVIPDGNGRWAKERGVSVLEGHNKGARVLENLLNDLEKIPDIKLITLWALSVDNLAKRSGAEVINIMLLAESMIERLLPTIKARGNKFIHIGDITKLPQSLQEKLISAQSETSENKGKAIRVGINYQGFQEDISLVNAAIEQFATLGRRPASRADIESLKKISQTPPADFVIRTSGEQRFSGLGSIAEQAELYAPKTLLPDMTSLDWALALSEFAFRDRRFGGRV